MVQASFQALELEASRGFEDAKNLARKAGKDVLPALVLLRLGLFLTCSNKAVGSLRLSSEQLSSQVGLRPPMIR